MKIRKRARQTNPRSLANLLPPAKKGEVRNPLGNNGNPEVMRIKRLAAPEVAEIGSLILEHNVSALQEIIDDARGPDKTGNPNSKHSSLKVWMAMIAIKGMTKGDPHALDALLNRITGKVANRIEMTGADGGPVKQEDVTPVLTAEERAIRIALLERIKTDTNGEGS